MSRAMNLKLAEADVVGQCAKAGVAISAIETLPQGGTHLVLVTPDGAETMRGVFAKSIIEGRLAPEIREQWHYFEEQSREMTTQDRSAIYGGFHIYGKKA